VETQTDRGLARFAEWLKAVVEWVGKVGSFFFLPLIIITVWDIFARKMVWIKVFIIENVSNYFESTMLQEMEWHSHTVLFALVLGYGFTRNRHVRVDLVRMLLPTRGQAIIEFIGTTFFMIPYTIMVIFFCYYFMMDSYFSNEISPSLVGLSHRWIIKAVLLVGLVVALASGVAVWMQTVLVLFGTKEWRFELMTLEWPEQTDTGVEGYKRMELSEEDVESIRPDSLS
jgi:TRAP-type mannitol/chloroaromatic compound transport system permease small subunit